MVPCLFQGVNISGTSSLFEVEYFRVGQGMSRGGHVQGMGTHPLWTCDLRTGIGTHSPWTSVTKEYGGKRAVRILLGCCLVDHMFESELT